MINKVTLIGHLGKDPEVRNLENGASIARFSVATNESYKDKTGEWQTITEWHNVVAWRNLAERVERDLKKGSLVYVEGKLTTRKWQDKEGNDRYTTEVVALSVKPLDRRESSSGEQGAFPSSSDEFPSTSNIDSSANLSTKTTNDDVEDDLPF